ncbi:hypothetical protein Ahy_B02g061164 [Arachis hypogaea]|uniref:SWIM-type domain-containing protein n=1 Tax=Arachis hypogaea TaxID=3818 RepID=A0A445AKE7_ARAHY|nr:hypothetical protein Ahy_B02g061164 [Arachis hypogaea]
MDIGFVGGGKKADNHDAFDPGSESDGANSWHSLEMKIPPNSEDELVGEESSDEVFPVFRQGARFGKLHLEVGMKFNTKWEFKEAVREFTIQEGRQMRFRKNSGKRVRVVCKVKDCKWVVYASRDHEDSCWQVKTFFNDHTCPREDRNRAANRNWVAGKLVKKLRKYPNFRNCEAITYFKTKYDLSLNRNSISRALCDARNIVYGDAKEQYAMLRDYGETLLKTNPGSTVQICTQPQPSGDVIFERMYVCLSGCKSVVKVENFENWKWFLELLHEDLGDYKTHGWNIISDMQKEYMDRIKRMNEDAWKYLDKWPREAWMRSQFRHNPKLDSICNNACEVFNSKIKQVRGKPILTLLEEVRMFFMRTMAKNKVKLDNHLGLLPPVIKSRLEKVRKESRNWYAIWSGDTGYEKFEVHGRPTNHMVDLRKRLCICQFWMLTGIPCVHACAALARVNKHSEDFCHKLITMKSYKETYKPLAPPIKRKPRNLQTKRRKHSDEGTSSSKKSKPVDAAAAAKAVEAAKDPKNATAQATATTQATATDIATATAAATSTATATANIINNIPSAINSAPIGQASEIDLSQPICSEPEDSQRFIEVKGKPATRPAKLPTRRRSPPTTPSTALDPMKGASSATASRFTNFLKFVPTPGFKHPQKK